MKPITFKGKSFESMSALARHYKIRDYTVYARLESGWPLEQALGLKPRPKRTASRAIKVEFGGKTFESRAALAAHYGISGDKLGNRLKDEWTMEQALGLKPRPKQSAPRAVKVTFGGKSFDSMKLLAKHYGISSNKMCKRLKDGWPMAQALELESRPKQPSPNGIEVTFAGKSFRSKTELAANYGLSRPTYSERLKAGWTMEQALGLEPPPPKFRNKDGSPREHLFLNPQILDDGSILPSTKSGCYKLYVITNQQNGKEYVGITTASLARRLDGHWGDMKRCSNNSSKLYNALSKALREGRQDDFIIEQIRNDAKDYRELQEQEIQEIADRDTVANGYNIASGGAIGNGKSIVIDGDNFPSHAAAAAFYNVDVAVFFMRLKADWTLKQAVGLDDPPDSLTGTKWMHQGDKQIKVHPADIDEKLAQGWLLGITAKNHKKLSKVTVGRKWMHQGNEQTLVRPDDIDEKLAQGWALGRPLGNKAT